MCERPGSLAVLPFGAAERLTVPDPLRSLARFDLNGSVVPLADMPLSLQAGFIEALQPSLCQYVFEVF